MEISDRPDAQAALPPGERAPRYPFDRRLDGPQSRSGHSVAKKKIRFTVCAGNGNPVAQHVA